MTRIQAGVLMLALVPVVWALIWVGWRGRARRQGDVASLPAVPDDLSDIVFGPVEATYVSTTSAGDWLDRIAVGGLGVRSAAEVGVHPGGVLLARTGAPGVWVPRTALTAVRRERGMAGKFVDRDGLVVLTWTLGDRLLDTGLRVRRETDRDALEDAVGQLLTEDGRHETEVPGA